MGLDMYLYRSDYIQNWNYEGAKKFELTIKRNGEPYPLRGNPSYIKSQVMYWRKANAIHRWFVENCQGGVDDCRTANVQLSQLEELLDIVNQALADPTKAAELLPSQIGFFFGSPEYDEYYFIDLEETKEELTKIIAEAKEDEENNIACDFEYHSSW